MTATETKLIKTIESDEGTTKVYDNGLIESLIHEGAHIDVPYLLEGKQLIERVLQGKKAYVLNEGAGFYRITREARELSASKDYSSHIACIAVITKHVAIKLVFDLYNKIDKPSVPTKAFTDREQAMKWLEEMMRK
jgi:hypothetical protein